MVGRLLLGTLAIVMFGLGLSLRVEDFRRLLHHPKAVIVALGLQLVGLPLACYGIVLAFGLSPAYAVGLMLLAAAPGGIAANLFSHLFGGSVAMNISLTAANTVLSMVTMPFIANWSISRFGSSSQVVPLQFGKMVEVIGVILVPVLLGMVVAARRADFALRMQKPVKVFSAAVLGIVTLLAIGKEWSSLVVSFGQLGPAVLTFNLVSLLSGYYVSRATGLAKPLATAVSFEIGIHNVTLALFVALSILQSYQAALPAAVYSVVMYVTAPLFGLVVLRTNRHKKVVALAT